MEKCTTVPFEWSTDTPVYFRVTVNLVSEMRKRVFFNDVPEVLSKFAIAELKNQSRNSAETPCGSPAWSEPAYNHRLAYVRCSLDNAIPSAAQDFMIQQSRVYWDIETFNRGHSPFLSQPKQLSDWTVAEITKFQTAPIRGGLLTSQSGDHDTA